jgi:hypothetical protein
MAAAGQPSPQACGCCQVPGAGAARTTFNRPGLKAIAYRTGDYVVFRQAMIQAIPRVGRDLALELGRPASPLARWTARRSDDYGVAVLELWAVVGDILTFYQERIANEAYLRTAVQDESVRLLAAMLDYRPAPGIAAGTLLAYTLEPAATIEVPTGLRAQSVARQGQVPQVFETVEAITASDRLNQVPVFPKPTAFNPFGQGSTSGTLTGSSPEPASGDRLLLHPTASGSQVPPESKVVDRVDEVGGRRVLTWSPPVQSNLLTTTNARLDPYRRTFRVFGSDAPPTYAELIDNETPPPPKVWDTFKTNFFLDSATVLPLDGPYEDLEVGTGVVVRMMDSTDPANPKLVVLVTAIDTVVLQHKVLGPVTGVVTVVTLADTILNFGAVDRRDVVVFELAPGAPVFLDWKVDPTIAKDEDTLYAPLAALDSVEVGRRLLVGDGTAPPEPVAVAAPATEVQSPDPGHGEFLSIPIDPPLSRPLNVRTAVLQGNVAEATHGESVRSEVLGAGDAALAFQSFVLAKQPLTRVRSAAAPDGAQSTLSVRVDQVEWQEVASLYGQPPTARIYTGVVDDQGRAGVHFGDGVTGARLPTGQKNVTATYRHGLGLAGDLDPGTITTALDRPPGLRSVTNPVRSSGGEDPEPKDAARSNAPNTVRTFDRAISLRDFEDLASRFGGVAKAQAISVWDGELQAVHLTVAGVEGAALSDEHLKDLKRYLDQRRDPYRALLVDGYASVDIKVTATVRADPAHLNPVVEAAVRAALDELFAFERRSFGQPVHLSDVYAALQSAAGVVSADVDALGYLDSTVGTAHGATSDPVQVRLPIFGARVNPAAPPAVPRVLLAELARAGPTAISVTVTGGLAA